MKIREVDEKKKRALERGEFRIQYIKKIGWVAAAGTSTPPPLHNHPGQSNSAH